MYSYINYTLKVYCYAFVFNPGKRYSMMMFSPNAISCVWFAVIFDSSVNKITFAIVAI